MTHYQCIIKYVANISDHNEYVSFRFQNLATLARHTSSFGVCPFEILSFSVLYNHWRLLIIENSHWILILQ